jgi:hypothetical protein
MIQPWILPAGRLGEPSLPEFQILTIRRWLLDLRLQHRLGVDITGGGTGSSQPTPAGGYANQPAEELPVACDLIAGLPSG